MLTSNNIIYNKYVIMNPYSLLQVKTNVQRRESSSDSEDDSDDQPLISHKSSSMNGTKMRSSQEDESSQSSSRLARAPVNYRETAEDTDEEDDLPLRLFRGKRKQSSDTEYSGEARSKRRKPRYSESNFSEDNTKNRRTKGKKLAMHLTDSDLSEEADTQRTRRSQQRRPRYNEDSDDESASGVGINTRGRGRFRNAEDDNDCSARTGAVVISSRGRVCRMTERARAAFLRD